MILRSVILENFGLYGGRVELDLTPRRRQGNLSPIVLIGGKNGTGKTTLLEAVRLALYGRRSLGARVAQSEYEDCLRSWIHRGLGSSPAPTGAAVGLEFDYAEAGVVHRYKVRRAWANRGRTVVESLILEKDGALISAVPREEWHLFLQELIPLGVSQLFFFDGEKIQEIADENQDEQLADAVRGLLGIDLVVRLRTDLGLYLARHHRGEDDAPAVRLEAVIRDLAVLDKQIALLGEELAQLASIRESQARAAEQARRRFIAEGGDLAARRAQIQTEAEDLTRQINRLQAELRDHANSLLPFTIAPRLTRAFRAALREAVVSQAGGRTEIAATLKEALHAWQTSNSPERGGTWEAEHWTDLNCFLEAWTDMSAHETRSPMLEEVGDHAAVLARLDESDAVTRPRVLTLAEELEALYARQRDVEAMLLRADKDTTSLLLDELRLAEQRVGATEATLQAREDELKRLRAQQTLLERERDRVLEEQMSTAAAERRTALAASVAAALGQYERQLLNQKLAQLRGEFVRCFNILARKSNLIADVRVDPDSFNVTLIDRNGGEIPKPALSAGEKQVYAIAILWALARTSGLALPMIIDTPLARLDSDHRANLVERYFPLASHQVVMLSTDTEVDASLFTALGRNVSHAYQLEYDAAEGRTIVRHGYFSEMPGAWGALRALQQA